MAIEDSGAVSKANALCNQTFRLILKKHLVVAPICTLKHCALGKVLPLPKNGGDHCRNVGHYKELLDVCP
jgi:hypothetical protein